MSYPVWPQQLSQFEREGWQHTPQEARRRRQGDAGPPGYRRRFSAAARIMRLALVTDRDGRAVFDRFWDDDTAQGSRLFWMPDPSTDQWGLLDDGRTQLLTGSGVPLLLASRWLVCFGDEMPATTLVGHTGFRIAFSVNLMP